MSIVIHFTCSDESATTTLTADVQGAFPRCQRTGDSAGSRGSRSRGGFVFRSQHGLAQSVDTRRFNLRVIAAFAVTALSLAVIGVYGVAAEAVVVRPREIGAAIGATGPQLTAAVVKSGLAPVLGGVLVGAGSALATTRALSSSLYGVTPYDPVTFASVLLLVAAVGSVALYLPARRVARVSTL